MSFTAGNAHAFPFSLKLVVHWKTQQIIITSLEEKNERTLYKLSTVCAHCTSKKNQHALMLFNGNRFRHTASSVQVNWK